MDKIDFELEDQLVELRELMEDTIKKVRPVLGKERTNGMRNMFDMMLQVIEGVQPLAKDGVKYRMLMEDVGKKQSGVIDRMLCLRMEILRAQMTGKTPRTGTHSNMESVVRDAINRAKRKR